MSDEATSPSSLPFSEDELHLLTSLPGLVGSVGAFSDVSGPLGTIKEMLANARATVAGRSDYSDNSIICAVVPEHDSRHDAMAVGIGGVRVSVGEQQILDELAAALGVGPADG